MTTHPRVAIDVDDDDALDIEYRVVDGPSSAPLIVFLHEGLGSVAMWKDFPDALCRTGGCRGLVYSRPGYGASTARPAGEKWKPDFMHRQAQVVLPALLLSLDIDTRNEPPWLFGHSDGASIALIHAASFPDRVAGLIVLAPHLDVEQKGIDSIVDARNAYLNGSMRSKLARHHADVDSAFWGWADIWLDPGFRSWDIRSLLPAITAPILAIQGLDDPYGTMAQIDRIAAALPRTELLELDDCRHSPHVDRPGAVIEASVHFIEPRASTTSVDACAAYPQDRLYRTN